MININVQLTKNDIGIILSGSELDLSDLYEAIYGLLPEDKDGSDSESITFLLTLAYDVRKAYSGHREEQQDYQPAVPDSKVLVKKTIYSVKILLPIVLVQIHLLAKYLESFNGKVEVKKIINHFSEQVLKAIQLKSQETYNEVIAWLYDTEYFSDDYLFEIVTHYSASLYVAYEFESSRLGILSSVLHMLAETHPSYVETSHSTHELAKRLNCSAYDLEFIGDNDVFEELDSGKISW